MFAQNSESTNKSSSVTVKPKRFTSRFAVRALWQRAIREQIILNRMDNENKRIQGNTPKNRMLQHFVEIQYIKGIV